MTFSVSLLAALVSSAVCTGPSGRAGADDSPRALFDAGISPWVVTVREDAPRPMRYAAEELTNFIFRISGARLGVTSPARAQKCNVVKIEAPYEEPLHDEFSVRTAPGEIVLRGNSPRAALFAVYAFLRDRLGARWFWPGESGEYLPKLDRFEVVQWEKRYKPSFDQRALSICRVWRHRHADVERWFARVFINCGINTPEIQEDIGAIRRATGHYLSLPESMDKRKDVFAEHPEWFSLLAGKRELRGYAGCWSNEGFFDYVVSNAVRIIRERRAQQANLFAADILPRCECPSCTENPDASARWWNFYARVIEAVRREIPGMRFTGLAYQEYRTIPDVPIRHLDHVEYCHYNRCYYHFLDDPACARNVRSMDELRRWGERAKLGFYGYEFDAVSLKKPHYLPLWKVIADQMRVFQKMGLERVKTEYQVDLHFLTRKKDPVPKSRSLILACRLPFYAWAMAAFDADLDMDALVDDFCRHVYGAGAADMEAYHGMMADAWGRMKSHITYFFNSPRGPAVELITDDLCRAARSRLSAAAKAAAADKRALGEIELDRECFENWVAEAEVARKSAVVLKLPPPSADSLAKASWLPTKAKHGKAQKTLVKVARGENALLISLDCAEKDMASFRPGTKRNDDANIWGTDGSVELFLETAGGVRHQIAMTPAGGVWDSRFGDLKWNSQAKTGYATSAAGWTFTAELPYAALGGAPKAGDRWKLMVIRNVPSDPGETREFGSCGWPVCAHGDWGSAATLLFD